MFCREQAVQLHREKDAILGLGAELVIVGNGNRHFARAFKDDLGLTTPLYVDTKKDAYRALEMKRSVLAVLTPAAAMRAVTAMLGGARQKSVQGDAWQMGGVLVVLPGGRLAYEHRSASPGDHPKMEDVLSALRRAVA